MNCADFHAMLHDFFIGELLPEKKKGLEEHAHKCSKCGELMRTAYEMTCKEAVEFLGEYVDGTLPPDRRAVFERHLAICPECTAYLASYQKTIALARSSAEEPDSDAPAKMPEALIRAIVSSLKHE